METSYEELPRDMILKIASQMDIDTKIRFGFIFKLKILCQVKKNLSNTLQTPTRFGDGYDDWWFINLVQMYIQIILNSQIAFGSIVYLFTSYTSSEREGTIHFSTHDVEGKYD